MLKLIFNGLAIVFALVCIWQISSLKTKKENEQNLIVKILQERDELLAEKEAFNKEHAARYSRERVKNQKLEDDKFEASMEESNQKKAKDQSISIIANLENSISESEKSLESSKLKSIEAGKEYEELLDSSAKHCCSIPVMEAKKDNLLNETRNLRMKSLS